MKFSIEAFLRLARKYKLSGRSIAESIVASIIILAATELFGALYNSDLEVLTCHIEISIVGTQLRQTVVIDQTCV